MKLIYFDEVKQDLEYPHYHIGAVCVDEQHLAEVEGEVNQIARETFGSSTLSSETEFHAAEIYHRRRLFKGWRDFDQRVALLARLIEILSREEVQLIDIQINCDLLSSNQSAEEIAFMFFSERANDLMMSRRSLGMIIGDRESDKHAAFFASMLSGYRAQGTDFAFGREIEGLVDSVHFTHSHLSRFLQLADVYVWLLQFRNRNRALGERTPPYGARLARAALGKLVAREVQGMAEVLTGTGGPPVGLNTAIAEDAELGRDLSGV